MPITLQQLKNLKSHIISKPTQEQLNNIIKDLMEYEINNPRKNRLDDSLTNTLPYIFYYFWDIPDTNNQWKIWQKKPPTKVIARNGFRCMKFVYKHCRNNFTPMLMPNWQSLSYHGKLID